MSNSLFVESNKRFVMFPIQHQDIWELYKKAVASQWFAEEIDLTQDRRDWAKLKPGEREFVKKVLAFFLTSDGIINENLVLRFMDEVKNAEARTFYGFQLMMENIHNETYSLCVDALIQDEEERSVMFNALDEVPAIRSKANWALKYISSSACFATRLVAFAAVEGIFFSGSFCAIFWLKKRGLMPGLCFANALISRDENLHVEFAALLYSKIPKLPDETVRAIIAEAVEAEIDFICNALRIDLIGMNARLMTEYIQYVADRLLAHLGVEPMYNIANPFEWMEMMAVEGKTNFFEVRVAEYRKAAIPIKNEDTKKRPRPGDDFSTTAAF